MNSSKFSHRLFLLFQYKIKVSIVDGFVNTLILDWAWFCVFVFYYNVNRGGNIFEEMGEPNILWCNQILQFVNIGLSYIQEITLKIMSQITVKMRSWKNFIVSRTQTQSYASVFFICNTFFLRNDFASLRKA